jgi:cyclohexyl-isocyanide hydratase
MSRGHIFNYSLVVTTKNLRLILMNDQPSFRIAMVVFPGLTQLDLTGPYEILNTSPAIQVDLLWHRLEPVSAQGGLILTPTETFDTYGQPDVLFIPGGPGVLEAMEDDALIAFMVEAAKNATFITSVCTGSLLLGAAGLLVGKRATCHWNSIDLLALMGAVPVKERVVEDGNIITGAGVTSGIDFALVVAARLLGEEAAHFIQLLMEYDPAPPYQSGSVDTAPPETVERINGLMKDTLAKRRAVAEKIGREKLRL